MPSRLKTQIAGEVRGFDPEAFMDKREARRLDRYTQLFMVSVDQAMADAGIRYEDPDDPEAPGRVW